MLKICMSLTLEPKPPKAQFTLATFSAYRAQLRPRYRTLFNYLGHLGRRDTDIYS